MSETISTSVYEDIWRIPEVNKPHRVSNSLYKELYKKDEIYKIDLNTRTITGPEILICQHDHNAETILFSVDRYQETFDLAEACCVIQFKTYTVNGDPFLGIYPVRYYDLLTAFDEGKIIIPWSISKAVTQSASTVEFNLRFYHIDDSKTEGKLDFNLNTLSAKLKVLQSLDIADSQIDNAYQNVINSFNSDPDAINYLEFLQNAKFLYETQTLYWTDV